MDKPPACPPRPQENKSRRSGQTTCYQNRTTSFAIDSLLCPRRSRVTDQSTCPLRALIGRSPTAWRTGQVDPLPALQSRSCEGSQSGRKRTSAKGVVRQTTHLRLQDIDVKDAHRLPIRAFDAKCCRALEARHPAQQLPHYDAVNFQLYNAPRVCNRGCAVAGIG
jgi:hypothetical protein